VVDGGRASATRASRRDGFAQPGDGKCFRASSFGQWNWADSAIPVDERHRADPAFAVVEWHGANSAIALEQIAKR